MKSPVIRLKQVLSFFLPTHFSQLVKNYTVILATAGSNFYSLLTFWEESNLWFKIIIITSLLIIVFVIFYYSRSWRGDRIVSNFYEMLNEKCFEKSWENLSDDIKKDRWENDLEKFENGYKYNISIDIKICKLNSSKGRIFQYIVIYKDTIDTPVLKKEGEIKKLRLCESQKFHEHILEISNNLTQNTYDGNVFLGLNISDFFKTNFCDTLRWRYQKDTLTGVTEDKHERKVFFSEKLVTVTFFKNIFRKGKISDIKNLSEYFT